MTAHYPEWTHELDEQALLAMFGKGTLDRGKAYARQGRVSQVAIGSGTGGSLIQAQVRGNATRPYQTLARQHAATGIVTTTCSCPVRTSCKHGAALLWHLRTANLKAMTPAWQRALTEIVGKGETVEGQPLALQVTRTQSADVQLRPLILGKSGRWVRTGISWDTVRYGWNSQGLPQHRRVLAGLAGTAEQGVAAGWHYSRRSDVIELDDLGPGVWHWLSEAQAAGVPLVPGPGTPAVSVAEHRAQVASRLVEARSGLELRTFVTAGDQEWPVLQNNLIGVPPHGFLVSEADRLLLVPFSEPLTTAQQGLLLRYGRLQIPENDVPGFATDFYPVLRRLIDVEVAPSVQLPTPAPPVLLLSVAFQADHVTQLAWSFRYQVGAKALDVPLRLTGERATFRDPEAEGALLDGLPEGPWPQEQNGAGHRPAATATLTGAATADFVTNWLERLRACDVIVEVTGEAQAYRLADEAPQVSLSITDPSEGTDWFNLMVHVSIDGEPVEYAELFLALATGETHLILPSGTWFSLERPELAQLRALIDEAADLQPREDQGLRLRTEHAGLWEELTKLGIVAEQSSAWTTAVSALLDLDELPALPAPAGLRATLRPYQEAGFRWLHFLHRARLGGILADDMGLGKTLQALALACQLAEQGQLDRPLLVVAPTSVLGTWAAEAARFAPDLRVVIVESTAKRRAESIAALAAGADLVVTSYTLLRLDADEYAAQPWTSVFLDEAQFVKNRQSQVYQAVRKLSATAKFAITGTPLENNLMDLWSLLSITAPGLFADPVAFGERYRRPIESGDAEVLGRLHRRVRPLMLRRTKESVAAELPPKQEQVLSVPLSPSHRRLYDKQLAVERKKVLGLVDDLRHNRITILASLTMLRQLSLSPALVLDNQPAVSAKIDALVELVTELAAEGHRALVFSQFTRYLGMVRDRLAAEGIGASYLDGRTRDRPARIESFRSGTDPVFLISLKAGGFGLTLTEADYVFILDPWWNPAAELQAIDRTHRIGQQRTVMVYRLVSEDTIEEKVVALQQRKRDLFAKVVGEGGDLAAPLSADDIRGLLEP